MLSVTYTLTKPGTRWRWGTFPEGWKWEGTNDMMRESPQIEEYFEGPEKSQYQMRKYLKKLFTNLKSTGIVKNFKITNTKNLPDD